MLRRLAHPTLQSSLLKIMNQVACDLVAFLSMKSKVYIQWMVIHPCIYVYIYTYIHMHASVLLCRYINSIII